MLCSLPSSPWRRLAAVLLLVVSLVGVGCGAPGEESPEALFAKVQELSADSEWGLIWALYTDDERRRQSDAWESYKEFLQKNPGEKNREQCLANFHIPPEELYPLTPRQIFDLVNQGHAGYMDGARIESRELAPDVPDGVRLWWVDRHGKKHSMLARQIDGAWLVERMVE